MVAALCQWLAGVFPCGWFAFPVGAVLAVAWLALLWVVWRERAGRAWVSALLAGPSLFVPMGMLALTCLLLGLTGRPRPDSWWFCAVLLAVLSQLWLVLLRGWRRRSHRWRFRLIHAGLFVALGAGFVGSADAGDWRMAVAVEGETRTGYGRDGAVTELPHALRLLEARTEHYANGAPRDFEARLLVDGKEPVSLRVNHPYALSWADEVYLVGFEPTFPGHAPLCIVAWVHEPWRPLVFVGILLLVVGSLLLFLGGPGRQGERRAGA